MKKEPTQSLLIPPSPWRALICLLCLQMCLFLTLAFEKPPKLLLSEPLGKQQQHLLEPWSQCRQWPSPECSRLNANEHHPLKTQTQGNSTQTQEKLKTLLQGQVDCPAGLSGSPSYMEPLLPEVSTILSPTLQLLFGIKSQESRANENQCEKGMRKPAKETQGCVFIFPLWRLHEARFLWWLGLWLPSPSSLTLFLSSLISCKTPFCSFLRDIERKSLAHCGNDRR